MYGRKAIKQQARRSVKRNYALLVTVCVVLLVCFAGDMVYSRFKPNAGAGITDYKQAEAVETVEAVAAVAEQ